MILDVVIQIEDAEPTLEEVVEDLGSNDLVDDEIYNDINIMFQGTPQITIDTLGAYKASANSPSPPMPLINTRFFQSNLVVNSILPSLVGKSCSQVGTSGGCGSNSRNNLVKPSRMQGSNNIILNHGLVVQPGPSGFVLVSFAPVNMVGIGGSLTQYPYFWGKGDEDVEQHQFLCGVIRRSRVVSYASKLVEFENTLRGQALIWYIKFIDLLVGG